jgi:hypothetical protein
MSVDTAKPWSKMGNSEPTESPQWGSLGLTVSQLILRRADERID